MNSFPLQISGGKENDFSDSELNIFKTQLNINEFENLDVGMKRIDRFDLSLKSLDKNYQNSDSDSDTYKLKNITGFIKALVEDVDVSFQVEPDKVSIYSKIYHLSIIVTLILALHMIEMKNLMETFSESEIQALKVVLFNLS